MVTQLINREELEFLKPFHSSIFLYKKSVLLKLSLINNEHNEQEKIVLSLTKTNNFRPNFKKHDSGHGSWAISLSSPLFF